MKIFFFPLIFAIFPLLFSIATTHDIFTNPKHNSSIEVGGKRLRVKEYSSKTPFEYAVLQKHSNKLCYELCGVRGFVEASNFYNFTSLFRGLIISDYEHGYNCKKFFEIDDDYSFLNNNDFCFCLNPKIQNIIYTLEGFPELRFPPFSRKDATSPYYNASLSPTNVYYTRTPCEGNRCSIKVHPYLVEIGNFTNKTIHFGKSELAVEADKVEQAILRDRQRLAKLADIQKNLQETLKKQAAHRKQLAEELTRGKLIQNQWDEIKSLRTRLGLLKGADEKNELLTSQLEAMKIDERLLKAKLETQKEEENVAVQNMVRMQAQLETLQQEIRELNRQVQAKEKVVAELDPIKIDYEVTREKLRATEESKWKLEEALQESQDDAKSWKDKATHLEQVQLDLLPAFKALEEAQLKIADLESKVSTLLDEKTLMEKSHRQVLSKLSEVQGERDNEKLKLFLCEEQVKELEVKARKEVGELQSVQQSMTELLRKEYNATVFNLVEEVRSAKEEANRCKARVSGLEQENHLGKEALKHGQDKVAHLEKQNHELKAERDEASKLYEKVSTLELDKHRIQAFVVTLKDQQALLEKEMAIRQGKCDEVQGNYIKLRNEHDKMTQALEEVSRVKVELELDNSKLAGVQKEKALLTEKLDFSQNRVLELERDNANLKDQIQVEAQESEQLEKTLAEMIGVQSKLASIHEEKTEIGAQLVHTQNKLRQLEEENERLLTDLERKKEVSQNLEDLEKEMSQVQGRFDDLELKKQQTEEALVAAREKVQQLGAQNTEMRMASERNVELERELGSTKQMIKDAESRLKEIEREKTEMRTQLATLEGDNHDLKKNLSLNSQLIHELQSTKSELDRVHAKLVDLEEQKSKAEEKWEHVQNQLSKMELENSQLKQNIDVRKILSERFLDPEVKEEESKATSTREEEEEKKKEKKEEEATGSEKEDSEGGPYPADAAAPSQEETPPASLEDQKAHGPTLGGQRAPPENSEDPIRLRSDYPKTFEKSVQEEAPTPSGPRESVDPKLQQVHGRPSRRDEPISHEKGSPTYTSVMGYRGNAEPPPGSTPPSPCGSQKGIKGGKNPNALTFIVPNGNPCAGVNSENKIHFMAASSVPEVNAPSESISSSSKTNPKGALIIALMVFATFI